jgi:hypothetical protein
VKHKLRNLQRVEGPSAGRRKTQLDPQVGIIKLAGEEPTKFQKKFRFSREKVWMLRPSNKRGAGHPGSHVGRLQGPAPRVRHSISFTSYLLNGYGREDYWLADK